MKIENSKLKIIFFGTPDFAMPVLDALIEAGYDVSHFRSKSLKDDAVFDEFKKLNPDLCVVAAYGKILPARYLNVPKHGFINIHPSLLPKYRGPSPIQTAVLNGDKETGVSIMVVDAEVDHGPVLASREFSISDGHKGHHHKGDCSTAFGCCSTSCGCFQFSNHNELAKELFKLGAKLLIEILPKYLNGEIRPVEQDHDQATFTKMFEREDGKINWSEPSEKIFAKIRALNPEPGTWSTWKPGSESSRSPEGAKLKNTGTSTTRKGKIINIKKAELFGDKIKIKIIQMEGKKEMPFEEFLRGHRDFDISQLK